MSVRTGNFESDGGTDDSKPEPLAKSAEVKRLVGIAVANGTPIRVAYKDVRKRMRIEARRQKEVDEGVEPEVVLDSFLNQVKVEQQQQSGPLKRVLTPHQNKQRVRLVCRGPVLRQNKTRVRPVCCRQPRSPTRDSWNN